MDLPFALARWQSAEGVTHRALSAHRSEHFGEAYGVLISEIFGSLLSAGLTIDFFHEHQFCAWECLPGMEEGQDRFLRFKDPAKREMLPLMFSLKATKKGA